jgi:hypothetical protein
VLGAGVNPRSASFYAAFDQRLRELGYIEGKTWLSTSARPRRGRISRSALVRQRPDVLVVGPEASMKAARRATRTIPIVMVALNYEPIALGYSRASPDQAATSLAVSSACPRSRRSSSNFSETPCRGLHSSPLVINLKTVKALGLTIPPSFCCAPIGWSNDAGP